jgi:CheY-like chemotaxis protein
LVVEDEPLIRMFVAEVLSNAGIEVLEDARADEALTILSENAERVTVVFTDVNMPGSMDGLQLAQRARDSWP